ncbi:MAG: CopG family transcriptional regulator [Anaerolineales bacterium]
MIRTQIQLTPDQVRWLKQKAADENTSMAEVIRKSLDIVMHINGPINLVDQRQKAKQVIGALSGPRDFAENHDQYLSDAYQQ